jgi:uncharacterized NAD(P)/FAD-binding protein YdhS
MLKVGIVGGGFSGICLAAELLLDQKHLCSVCLIEKREQFGLGIAYSTPSPWHLLNVRAMNMGISEDDIADFFQWLKKNESIWRNANAAFHDISLTEDSYLPRQLYALYLKNKLEELKKNSNFNLINRNAIDVELMSDGKLKIVFDDGKHIAVDRIVLATGVETSKKLPFAISHERYFGNVWKSDVNQNLISDTDANSKIFIIGTGLTALDVITSLDRNHYQGKIIALSNHGDFPEPHLPTHLPLIMADEKILTARNLREKFHYFNTQLIQSENTKLNWRQLFDSLRPFTPIMWKQLSIEDRKRFLRHLLSFWNRHRHRMPPASEHMVCRMKNQNRLDARAGKVIRIEVFSKDLLKVVYKLKGSEEELSILVSYVYNCTGPGYLLKSQTNIILQNLLQHKFILEDELGLGVKTNRQLEAEGLLAGKIYAMGPLLYGEQFEATAVPEIRKQAKTIASGIATHLF